MITKHTDLYTCTKSLDDILKGMKGNEYGRHDDRVMLLKWHLSLLLSIYGHDALT